MSAPATAYVFGNKIKKVSQNDSGIVLLGEVAQDTLITAGSNIILFTSDRPRTDVKEVRATARWLESNAKFRFTLAHYTSTSNTTLGGPDQILEFTDKSYGLGKVGDVCGTFIGGRITNTNSVDQTLRFCQFVGVK